MELQSRILNRLPNPRLELFICASLSNPAAQLAIGNRAVLPAFPIPGTEKKWLLHFQFCVFSHSLVYASIRIANVCYCRQNVISSTAHYTACKIIHLVRINRQCGANRYMHHAHETEDRLEDNPAKDYDVSRSCF